MIARRFACSAVVPIRRLLARVESRSFVERLLYWAQFDNSPCNCIVLLMFKFFTFYAPMSLVPARAWHDLDGEELRVEESRNNTCPSITAIFFTSPTCRQLLTPFVGGVMSDKKRREVKFSWVLRALEPEGSLLGGGGAGT